MSAITLELTRRGATVREAPKVIEETAEYLRLEVCAYDAGLDLEIPTGLTPAQLRSVAGAYVGAIITDLEHLDGKGQPARIGVVVASRLEGQRIIQQHDYWPPAPDNPNLWRELREARQGYSIHWRETVECRMECSRCGADVGRALDYRWLFEDWACGHVMGRGGVKALYTDVSPVEVAKTYLPGCGGTGVLQELRTRARAASRAQRQERTVPTVTVTPAPGALTIDWSPVEGASSYDLLISTELGADEAAAEVITGATRPHKYTGEPGKTYYVRVRANTEAGAEVSDEVSAAPLENDAAAGETGDGTTQEDDMAADAEGEESLRTRMRKLERDNASMRQRMEKAEAEALETKRTATLRSYRRSGYLSGSDKQLLEATTVRCSCGRRHPLEAADLKRLMERVTPGEPRPIEFESFGADQADAPMASLPAPQTSEQVKQQAELLASRDKIPYDVAHRRITNSLSPRPPKAN